MRTPTTAHPRRPKPARETSADRNTPSVKHHECMDAPMYPDGVLQLHDHYAGIDNVTSDNEDPNETEWLIK